MAEAYIIDTVRSPVGKRGGSLAQVHPADLGAHAIGALIDRTGVDPAAVEDVVFGCVDTIGPQAGDIARTAWLAAGMPEEVPGTTIDRQCGSSQQAVHFAAQAVMSGTTDLVVAGGVQNMSAIPISAAMLAGEQFGFSDPFSGSEGWQKRYGDQEVEPVPRRRDDRGATGTSPVRTWRSSRSRATRGLSPHVPRAASMPRSHPSPDCLTMKAPVSRIWTRSAASPALVEGGRLTAALASQISDASAAMLVASEAAVAAHGLTPRARVHHISVRGEDPIRMLSAPIPATRYALERAGMTMDDIDLVEINEAFASVVMAWEKELDVDHAKVNVNGGAIALGHPLGATGVRLMTTLLHELERTGGRYGLQTMCEGGGQANVTIIERL